MNTVTLKASHCVDINSKVVRDKIFTVIEAARKQIKNLAWLFEHTPSYSERLLRDEYLGPEFRRMKW